jgi:hypothetical protein
MTGSRLTWQAQRERQLQPSARDAEDLTMDDRNEIVGLVGTLAVRIDARRWDDLQELFASELQADWTSLFGGERQLLKREQLIDNWRQMLPSFTHTTHLIGPADHRPERRKSTACWRVAHHRDNARPSLVTETRTCHCWLASELHRARKHDGCDVATVALVTGANRGLGLEVSRQLAEGSATATRRALAIASSGAELSVSWQIAWTITLLANPKWSRSANSLSGPALMK